MAKIPEVTADAALILWLMIVALSCVICGASLLRLDQPIKSVVIQHQERETHTRREKERGPMFSGFNSFGDIQCLHVGTE